MPTDIGEFREHLAQIDDPQLLDAICLGAVFTGGLADHEDEQTGTLLQVTQRLGAGLFGPTVYTYVKLCPACVHKSGGDDCLNSDQAEEYLVTYVEHVRRNGDAPAPLATGSEQPRPVSGAVEGNQ